MSKLPLIAAILLGGSAASHALTCEALKSEIDRKIQSSGVTRYSLVVSDVQASAPGKQVGTCENGTRKIMYTPLAPAGGAAAGVSPVSTGAAPAPRRGKGLVLTECKEGYTGPDCQPAGVAPGKGGVR